MAIPDPPASRLAEAPGRAPPAPQPPSGALRWLAALGARSDAAAAVLGMFLYFLMLGSVAVVVVTGQFPWFTVAPAALLLAAAHVHRVEARWARQAAAGRERATRPDRASRP
jgi:hypothetical protein